MTWRYLRWSTEAAVEQGKRWDKEVFGEPTGTLPWLEVISDGAWCGTVLVGNWTDGLLFGALLPPSIDDDVAAGVDDCWYENPEPAAALMVALFHGLDPRPWVEQADALFRLDRAEIRLALAERDGWTCHICGKPIPRRLRAAAAYDVQSPDPLFPDIEHVIPLVQGGAHWWGNLRLAHRRCNQSKGKADPGIGDDVATYYEDLCSEGMMVPGEVDATLEMAEAQRAKAAAIRSAAATRG